MTLVLWLKFCEGRKSCMSVKMLECFSIIQHVAYEAAYKLIVLAQTVRVYLFIPEFRI